MSITVETDYAKEIGDKTYYLSFELFTPDELQAKIMRAIRSKPADEVALDEVARVVRLAKELDEGERLLMASAIEGKEKLLAFKLGGGIETYDELKRISSYPDNPAPQQTETAPPLAVLTIGQSYPCFLEHYAALQNGGYIAETKNGLRWEKSKQSLAEYFDAIKPKERKHNWATLENFFGVKDLKQAASQNGNPFKGKKSRDFDALRKIITLP